MTKRGFIAAALLAAFAPALMAKQEAPRIEVWRSPDCGCCGGWVQHLQDNGFDVKVHMVADAAPMRRALGMPDALGSCHTAKVGGYVVEGHVPASDIERLLRDKPRALGLAIPGMPQGAPGMDIPGSPPYDVLLVSKDGRTSLYQRHR